MLNKKKIFDMMTIAMVMVSSIVFVSCKDDDDINSMLNGTWNFVGIGSSLTSSGNTSGTITFSKDGTITWAESGGTTQTGKYVISNERDILNAKACDLAVTWSNGKVTNYMLTGIGDKTMTLTLNGSGISAWVLTRPSKDKDNGKDSGKVENSLVGTWAGDHSESYWEDWTFKKDGTGERHTDDGTVGSWYKFTYKVQSSEKRNDDYYGYTISGKVYVKYDNGNEKTISYYKEGDHYLKLDGYQLHKE